MADNRINLSPRQILSHLIDVERIAPRKDFHIYIPTKVLDTEISEDLLGKEAKKMMESVGLYNFEYHVTYAKTAEGTAGCCLNNGANMLVNIQVSEEFRHNWKSSVAILAHEVCHKILFFCGLYKPAPFENMNEVYAELATIYFGFGEIILAGYNTNNHCLGYLTPETYKKINLLVCVVCGNIKSEVLNLQDIDPLADMAVEIWEKDDDKRSLIIDCFKQSEGQIAEYHRNILLSKQVLDKLVEDVRVEFERWNRLYFKDFLKSDYSRLEAFLFIYDNYCARDFNNERINQLNETLNDSLYALFSKYQEKRNLELKYDFTCPVCGASRENGRIRKVCQSKSVLSAAITSRSTRKNGMPLFFNAEQFKSRKRRKRLLTGKWMSALN